VEAATIAAAKGEEEEKRRLAAEAKAATIAAAKDEEEEKRRLAAEAKAATIAAVKDEEEEKRRFATEAATTAAKEDKAEQKIHAGGAADSTALAAAALEIKVLKLRLDEALAKVAKIDRAAQIAQTAARRAEKESKARVTQLRDSLASQAAKCTKEVSRQSKVHRQKVMVLASEKLDTADRLSELEHDLGASARALESCKIKLDSATVSTGALLNAKAVLEAEILQLEAEKADANREL
jgi:hypothetical protein